jgi:hypothetical protein
MRHLGVEKSVQNNDLIDHYVYRIRSNVLIDHYVSEMLESLSVCYSFIVMCSHIETPICIYKLYPHQVKPYQFLPARIGICLRGPHNFIFLEAPKGHIPALPARIKN